MCQRGRTIVRFDSLNRLAYVRWTCYMSILLLRMLVSPRIREMLKVAGFKC